MSKGLHFQEIEYAMDKVIMLQETCAVASSGGAAEYIGEGWFFGAHKLLGDIWSTMHKVCGTLRDVQEAKSPKSEGTNGK